MKDDKMSSAKSKTYIMTSAAIMTAVMCILAPLSVPIGPVPVSLGTLVLYFSVVILGTQSAFISCVLYLLLGAVGLPVFTGFTGGLAKVAGPTGGYMLGYLFLILTSGIFIDRFAGGLSGTKKKAAIFIALAIGTAVLYAFGLAWFCKISGMTAGAALAVTVYPFIPLDVLKMILASAAGPMIRDRLKQAGVLR